MAMFFRGFHIQSRLLHRSTVAYNTAPSFNFNLEKTAFQNVLPEVIQSVVTGPTLNQLPEVQTWVKKLLEYTLPGGKYGRGLTVAIGYRMFEDPENFSEETQHSARVLGWCIEMLQADFFVMDDLIDGGTFRRGKPCWHLQNNVGLSAINDGLLLYNSVMEIFEIYFGKAPFLAELTRQFNETVYRGCIGEHLDCWSGYNKEKNYEGVFSMDRYNVMATNKTYYSVKFPIFAALLLVKNGKEKSTSYLSDLCLDIGRLLQVQDDYMDAYGDESVTGKTCRDIQEGKCTWVAVTALQHCNEAQHSLFKENYGSNDPERVKRIKRLYDELRISQLYEQYESKLYEDLVRRISALPTEGAKKFLLELLNGIYKRVN